MNIRLRRAALAGLAIMALAGLQAATVAAAPRPAPPPLQGQVTHVSDGHSLSVTVPGQPPLLLRLRDIEAPEPCQPGGAEAQRMLGELALHKAAVVQVGARDARGRTIARVLVDEFDLSRRMVEEGYAWSVRGKWDRGPLVKEERMAQTLHRGLHAGAGMVSPTEHRKRHGDCSAAAPAAGR